MTTQKQAICTTYVKANTDGRNNVKSRILCEQLDSTHYQLYYNWIYQVGQREVGSTA